MYPSNHRKKCRHGLSLVEVLCAMSLITGGVFASMQVFQQSANQMRTLAQEQLALRVLENEIELMRGATMSVEPGENLPLASGPEELSQLPQASGVRTVFPHGQVPGLARVVVRLQWSGPHGRLMTRSLTTLVSTPGAAP